MYEDRQKPSLSQTRLQPVHIHKDIAYKLNDVLFSIARFTKCLFRREIDMYRRWRGITALTLVLLYEKHYGWEAETVKKELGSHEAARLVDNLEHHEKQAVDCIYPPVARVDLAQSYEAALHLIIELSKEKARYFYLPLDYEFIEYMKSFLVTEMCRYSQQHRIGSFESYP